MQPCTCPQDGTLPYFYEDRAVQCSVHNRRMRVSDLVPASLRNERENQPCRLFCYSATIQTYYIGSNVEDGTKCDQYSNDRCYRGDCQKVGCDNQRGSNLQYDYCGCCGGNNSTCIAISGTYTRRPRRSGYYSVTVIPAGARRIRVEQIRKSISLFFAAKVNGRRFLGLKLLPYDVKNISGTLFEYYRPHNGLDVLIAPGPTADDIELEALIYAGRGPMFGLRYTYATHSASSFVWKPEAFGHCNVTCGGGVQTRKVTCRCSGTLEMTMDQNCVHIVKPPTSRSCNTFECPYWKSGQWSSCSATCGNGYQKRTRKCITPLKAVSCPSPKPRKRRKCNRGGCR
jgi:hypothetical protein